MKTENMIKRAIAWYYACDDGSDHQSRESHCSNGKMSGRAEQVINPAWKDRSVQTIHRRHAGQQCKTHSLQCDTIIQHDNA